MDTQGLKAIPLFASLSDDALRALSASARELTVSEGTHIVDEGQFSYEFYAIADGTAEVLREGDVVAQLGPGDFFGETGVVDKARRNATVVARSRVHLLTLTGWDLRRLRGDMPELVETISRAVEQRRLEG
ncbi:MAG TPA: cyclic nucleotide-binding domain-containing protein [Solirubrobacteraceae bacterium]|jgi:CRP-like cAMP-binding protein|nr:cyclic nucleotide-binding domain-containing protein [Solirubrobacteraceae bacterium]